MPKIAYAATATASLLAVLGCASRSHYQLSREGERAQKLFQARRFDKAAKILAKLTKSERHRLVGDKLLACCLSDTDYGAALTVLGHQASNDPDVATRAKATLAMAAICAKQLSFSLRAAQLMKNVRAMAEQAPSIMHAVSEECGFSPEDESHLRREQKTYGEWWDRFSSIKDLYTTGQHSGAAEEIERLRMETVADPLLSLWAGKVKTELGDLEQAARDLEGAKSRFTDALRMLDTPAQWQQPNIYEDELNECLLALGRCFYLMGNQVEAQVELGRVPEWSRFHAPAQALAQRARSAPAEK